MWPDNLKVRGELWPAKACKEISGDTPKSKRFIPSGSLASGGSGSDSIRKGSPMMRRVTGFLHRCPLKKFSGQLKQRPCSRRHSISASVSCFVPGGSRRVDWALDRCGGVGSWERDDWLWTSEDGVPSCGGGEGLWCWYAWVCWGMPNVFDCVCG